MRNKNGFPAPLIRLVFRYSVLSVVLVFLYVPASQAHKVKMFATAEGNLITGYVYYTTGGKPKQAVILVEDPQGNRLGNVTTDDNGEFTFTANLRQDYVFILELADGHRATFTVTADELPETLSPPEGKQPVQNENGPNNDQDMTSERPLPASETHVAAKDHLVLQLSSGELEDLMDKAVSKQMRLLREQLEHYEEKVRLHDILGGIGYIIGLMGLGYFLSARRRK